MQIKLNKLNLDKSNISYSFYLTGLIWNEYIDKQNSFGTYIAIISKFSNGDSSNVRW